MFPYSKLHLIGRLLTFRITFYVMVDLVQLIILSKQLSTKLFYNGSWLYFTKL